MKLETALESCYFVFDLDRLGFVTENTLYPGVEGYIHRVYRNGEKVGTVEACMHCEGIIDNHAPHEDQCPTCGWNGDPDDKPDLGPIWG